MITTKFILREDKTRTNGKAPLYLRITQNRKHSNINTGIRVESGYWDESRQKLKSHYSNSGQANAFLRRLVSKVESVAYEFEQQDRFYTAKMVKDKVQDQNDDNLIALARSWITDRKTRGIITHGTYLRYCGVISKLEQYSSELKVREFNREFVARYEGYLIHGLGNKKNTALQNMSMLRALANNLVEEGLIKVDDNPFKGYHFQYENTGRNYLTSEDIEKFASVVLEEGSKIKLSQDIFLFCTQTGLRIGDALRLTKECFNGTHLIFFSQKTRQYETLKLTARAMGIILPRIRDERPSDSFIFDFLNKVAQESNASRALRNQKSCTALINKNLKIIGRRAGLRIKLHSHLARHSLATNALVKGLRMEDIQAILGHNNIRTTQIYAKIVDEIKDRAIDKLES